MGLYGTSKLPKINRNYFKYDPFEHTVGGGGQKLKRIDVYLSFIRDSRVGIGGAKYVPKLQIPIKLEYMTKQHLQP